MTVLTDVSLEHINNYHDGLIQENETLQKKLDFAMETLQTIGYLGYNGPIEDYKHACLFAINEAYAAYNKISEIK